MKGAKSVVKDESQRRVSCLSVVLFAWLQNDCGLQAVMQSKYTVSAWIIYTNDSEPIGSRS